MSNYHRIRLHFVISLAGSFVFLFGVFILASGIMITDILSKDEFIHFRDLKLHSCQYWAGIPVSRGTFTCCLALLRQEDNLDFFVTAHLLKYGL